MCKRINVNIVTFVAPWKAVVSCSKYNGSKHGLLRPLISLHQ